MTPEKLAELIAHDLFTDGCGNVASRLALEMAPGDDWPVNKCSGWSERAVAQRILMHLSKAESEAPK